MPNTDDQYQNNSKYWKQRSEAWAVGRIDANPVPNTDACYENNSKWWSDVSKGYRDATENIRNDAAALVQTATDRLTGLNIVINYSDGSLYYDVASGIILQIDTTTGNLMYGITT